MMRCFDEVGRLWSVQPLALSVSAISSVASPISPGRAKGDHLGHMWPDAGVFLADCVQISAGDVFFSWDLQKVWLISVVNVSG